MTVVPSLSLVRLSPSNQAAHRRVEVPLEPDLVPSGPAAALLDVSFIDR